MAGVTNLTELLRTMQPELHATPYGHGLAEQDQAGQGFARIVEDEGVTVIAPIAELAAIGIAVTESWARISLTVHSDLAAVGLTAAFTRALADAGISANVVAGTFHDHIFVPWLQRDDAMAALRALGNV